MTSDLRDITQYKKSQENKLDNPFSEILSLEQRGETVGSVASLLKSGSEP